MVTEKGFLPTSGDGCGHCRKQTLSFDPNILSGEQYFVYRCPLCRSRWGYVNRAVLAVEEYEAMSPPEFEALAREFLTVSVVGFCFGEEEVVEVE